MAYNHLKKSGMRKNRLECLDLTSRLICCNNKDLYYIKIRGMLSRNKLMQSMLHPSIRRYLKFVVV